MKTFIYILAGAVIAGAVCVGITWGIGALFGPLYQGEAESARNFKIFLAVFSISLIAGGFGGLSFSRRKH